MSNQPKPTTGEWTLVPRALHFNIMCGYIVIYEGVTSEKQGNALVDAHNDAIAEAQDKRHMEKAHEEVMASPAELQARGIAEGLRIRRIRRQRSYRNLAERRRARKARAALDSLGVALHGHQWTEGERAIYKESIKTLWDMAEAHRQLQRQLAAEREKADISIEQWRNIAADSANENLQLRSQLAAWQETFGTTQLTHAIARLESAEKQLAAAQAAIVAHNKLSNERALGCPINYNDTTALDAAIAAARKLTHQAEQAATDNADWFDQLCIDLRELMGMPEDKRPFEVQPILDEVAKRHARMSERKSVHQWLTAQNIPEEENGKRICLLRRLRITLDRLAETEHQLAADREQIATAVDALNEIGEVKMRQGDAIWMRDMSIAALAKVKEGK